MSDMPQNYPVNAAPPTVDPVAAARWWQGGAGLGQAGEAWLHDEVSRRMEDRLQWIRLQPQRWIHWMPTVGGLQAHARLAQHYPQAQSQVVEASPARLQAAKEVLLPPWWRRWGRAVPAFQPPEPGQAQMVWANMLLHGSADPQRLFQQWHQALSVDGFVMFSCLGPDTLREWHAMYQQLGWPPAGSELTDMHDWGDMLIQAGFAEPVMDMERITLTYDSPEKMLQDLRSLGRNLHPQRFQALRGRQWRQTLLDAMRKHLALPDGSGRLALTFEIIYGHALKPVPRVPVATQTAVSLADMRSLLQQTGGGSKGPSAV